jgi:hypothetical protein
MTPTSAKVLAKAEFDEMAFEHLELPRDAGAQENARLLPLVRTLLEIVEAPFAALTSMAAEKERVERPCPGSHSYYSSMHPNADTKCPICGNSEDSLGRDIVAYYPTKNAHVASAILAATEVRLEGIINGKQ